MLKTPIKIIIIIALLLFVSVFHCRYASATPIDQQIVNVFNRYFERNDYIIGAAVVNVQTGEIMAMRLFDPASINGRSNAFSASLTNIVRSISGNLGKMGDNFSWAGIRFSEGVFYLKMINSETYIGCFFKPDLNPQEARITLIKKVFPAIKNILN